MLPSKKSFGKRHHIATTGSVSLVTGQSIFFIGRLSHFVVTMDGREFTTRPRNLSSAEDRIMVDSQVPEIKWLNVLEP